MTEPEAAERIEKLITEIDEHRYAYHTLDNPTISDEAYDSLVHELEQLEGHYPKLLRQDSPTQRVGAKPDKRFAAVKLNRPMFSLRDMFSHEELEAWAERLQKLLPTSYKSEYHLDIKMDGLACSLVYEDGVLVQGITRGDGITGEDVTSSVRTIASVPLRLRRDSTVPPNFYSGRIEVRGEVLLYKQDFEAINKEREAAGQPLFANPRNTAAGTLRQLDPAAVAKRPLRFHVYSLLSDPLLPTHAEEYELAQRLGFIVNEQHKVVQTLKEVETFVDHWQEARHDLKFNTDGLVVTLNDRQQFDKLGAVGRTPRGAVAYKYPPEQVTTKVRDIFVSIGRTGAATPVAVLEPVVVAGSTVQMATLHNESEVARKDVRVGDTIILHKAGDIIPEVVQVLVNLRDGSEQPFRMPTHCPECNTKLDKQVETEAVWRCPNLACPARLQNQITHFASKAALDIDGMGEKNVLALLDAGLIKDSADIFKLTNQDLLKLDRFAEVSAQNLISAIAEKKQPPLARFVFGLGIRHVGTQTAQDLANTFKSLEKIAVATVDELHAVDGVGEVVAESIVAWFGDETNQQLLEKFKQFGVKPEEVVSVGGPLAGMSFVVTGKLSGMGREEAADRIRALGGTFQSSVAKGTTYLVHGDKLGESKRDKAESYGTKLLDEDAFLKLIDA